MSSPGPSDEVKLKLRHGQWEIEISCSESKIKQVVENVLSSVDKFTMVNSDVGNEIADIRREINSIKSSLSAEPGISRVNNISQQKESKGGGITCRGLLEKLWFEGYFSTEKSLGEVHEELARRGYNYDRTAVSHSLTDMLRETILSRLGTMRNYRYIQKRPPVDDSNGSSPANL